MISIDADLRRTASDTDHWSADAARAVADSLARGGSAKIDWDDGAGERWLRVLEDRQAIALVSTILPLIIIDGPGSSPADTPRDMVIIHVDDLDGIELSASPETLGEVFGLPDRFHVLDPTGFSANDLWYATV